MIEFTVLKVKMIGGKVRKCLKLMRYRDIEFVLGVC